MRVYCIRSEVCSFGALQKRGHLCGRGACWKHLLCPFQLWHGQRSFFFFFLEGNSFASSGDSLLVFLACSYCTSCWSDWSTDAPSMAHPAQCCCNKYLPVQQPEVFLPGFSVYVLLWHLAVYIRHTDRFPPTHTHSKVDLLESENRLWTLFNSHACTPDGERGRLWALPSLCWGLQVSLAHVLCMSHPSINMLTACFNEQEGINCKLALF